MDIKQIINKIDSIISDSSLSEKEQKEIKAKINKAIFTSFIGSKYLYKPTECGCIALKIKNITTENDNIYIHLTDESMNKYSFSLDDLEGQIFVDVKNAKEYMKNELMLKNMFDRFKCNQKMN